MAEAFIMRRAPGGHKRLDVVKNGRVLEPFGALSSASNVPGSVTADWSYGPGYINIRVMGWSGGIAEGYFSSSRPVDAGPYATLFIEFEQDEPVVGGIGLQSGPGCGTAVGESETAPNLYRQTVSLDISLIRGQRYPFVRLKGPRTGAGNTGRIYNIWLER